MLGPRDLPRVNADTRVAASVTLLAVVVCASAAFALTPRAGAVSVATSNRLAQASPPPVVKIVNATPRSERCEEQTWPYFDRRCLPSAAQSPPAASASASALPMTAPSPAAAQPVAAAQPAKPSASPSTARQVTGGGSPAANPPPPQTSVATTGIASRDDLSPAMRAEFEDMQRRDELIAAWEAEEAARYAEEDRPPEPRRRKTRRHHPHFGFFGFGLRF